MSSCLTIRKVGKKTEKEQKEVIGNRHFAHYIYTKTFQEASRGVQFFIERVPCSLIIRKVGKETEEEQEAIGNAYFPLYTLRSESPAVYLP